MKDKTKNQNGTFGLLWSAIFLLTALSSASASAQRIVIVELGDVVDTFNAVRLDAQDMRVQVDGSMVIASAMRRMTTGTMAIGSTGSLTMSAGSSLNIVNGSFDNRGDYTARTGSRVNLDLNRKNSVHALSGSNAFSSMFINMLGGARARGGSAGGGFSDAPVLTVDANNAQTVNSSFTISSDLQNPLKLRSSIAGRAAILRFGPQARASAGVVEVRDLHVAGGELCVAPGSRILSNVRNVRVCGGPGGDAELFGDGFESL